MLALLLYVSPLSLSVDSPLFIGLYSRLLRRIGGSATLALPGVGVYSLDPGDGAVHAMVSVAGPSLNAAYPVWSAEALNDAVRVYP